MHASFGANVNDNIIACATAAGGGGACTYTAANETLFLLSRRAALLGMHLVFPRRHVEHGRIGDPSCLPQLLEPAHTISRI